MNTTNRYRAWVKIGTAACGRQCGQPFLDLKCAFCVFDLVARRGMDMRGETAGASPVRAGGVAARAAAQP